MTEKFEKCEIENSIIYSYTDEQATSDGIIHKLGNSPHRITNNLFVAIQEKYKMDVNETYNFVLAEILPLVPYAVKEYDKGGILKSDFNFKGGKFKHSKIIWFIPNENNGITAMKPEDY